MKSKNVVKLLCVSLAMIMIGVIITVSAAFSGGKLGIAQSRHGIFSLIKWQDSSSKSSIANNNYTSDNTVSNLIVDVDCGEIKVASGSTFNIQTKAINKEDISISENNGEYHITVSQNKINLIGDNEQAIYITLPESTKDISINQALGEVEMSNLSLTNLNINNDLGSVDLENVTFENGKISLSMGDLDFYGDFVKQLNIQNSAGEVDVHLMKNEAEYNYDLHVSMGDLELNDYNQGSIDANYKQNNQKEATLYAEVDLGDLKIDFGLED